MKSTLHVYIINNRLSLIINAFQFATGWKTGLPSLSKSLWWKAAFAFLHPLKVNDWLFLFRYEKNTPQEPKKTNECPLNFGTVNLQGNVIF